MLLDYYLSILVLVILMNLIRFVLRRYYLFIMKGMDFMKFIGIVRKVDELGCVVIFIELCCILNINIGDLVEIYVDEDIIIL